MNRRLFFWTAMLVLGVLWLGPTVEIAEACPMCSEVAATDDNSRPRAYMYSILFMLSVPAMLLTGFGIGFYRLSKQQTDLRSTDPPSFEA